MSFLNTEIHTDKISFGSSGLSFKNNDNQKLSLSSAGNLSLLSDAAVL